MDTDHGVILWGEEALLSKVSNELFVRKEKRCYFPCVVVYANTKLEFVRRF